MGKPRKRKFPEPYHGQQPSKVFLELLVGGTTAHGLCEFCDRDHFFDAPAFEWDDAEYENLIAEHSRDPEATVKHNTHVRIVRVEGKQAVVGCPCNGLRRYEDWI